MERSSVLKECPRCGLKNRSGAGQCDFCGWDFNAAADEWMNQVVDLQRVSRDQDEAKIDGQTKSRIELTMKDTSVIPAKKQAPEEKMEIPPRLTLDEPGDILTAATLGGAPAPIEERIDEPASAAAADVVPEPCFEHTAEPIPAPETLPEPEEIPAPAVEVAPAPPPAVESMPEEKAEAPLKSEAVPEVKSTTVSSFTMPAAFIAVGVVIYAAAVYLTFAQDIPRTIGWVMAIAASAILVAGTVRLWPLLRGPAPEENEVVLCPSCHEVVSDVDNKCPSCGVKFKEP